MQRLRKSRHLGTDLSDILVELLKNPLSLDMGSVNSTVGTARSCYIEAIQKAKEGKWEEIDELFKTGDEAFNEGHDAHMGLLMKEAEGKSEGVNLLLLHAEDQLMSAEGFKTVALEMIDVYKRLEKLENK